MEPIAPAAPSPAMAPATSCIPCCTNSASPANPTGTSRDDGLKLRHAWIASVVRCAPPGDKPTPQEIRNCATHLAAEIEALPKIRVVVCLGKIAFDGYMAYLLQAGDHHPQIRLPLCPRSRIHPAKRSSPSRQLPPVLTQHQHGTAGQHHVRPDLPPRQGTVRPHRPRSRFLPGEDIQGGKRWRHHQCKEHNSAIRTSFKIHLKADTLVWHQLC